MGRAIRRLRREREISQEALAALAGVGPNTVGDIERAVMGARVTTVVKIANGLGVPVRELFPEA